MHTATAELIVCFSPLFTAPLLLSMYGEVLSAVDPVALLSSLYQSFVHPVTADPGSTAPNISQVGAKADVLVQLKLQQVKLSALRIASQDEQKLLRAELSELDETIANYHYDADDDESWETEETEVVWRRIGYSKWEKIEDPTVTISLPNTPAKACLLSARHLLMDKQEQFETADEAEIKLARDTNALQRELPRWRRLLFFLSGNGRLLNQLRFACFLVVVLVLSSLLLYISSGGSTGEDPGSKLDGGGVGSVYGMLQAHCDHVPENIGGAYFDFWTIWVLITVYCAVSALFVSRVLLHDLAQVLLERIAGCICCICCCGKTKTSQPAG
jgi:hypothetical protein